MKTGRHIFSIILVSIFILGACNSPKKEEASEQTESDTLGAANEDHLLTAEQKAEGWKPLFNGKNLEGWKIYKSKDNNSWEVVEGTLHCKPFDSAAQRSDIMTVQEYENFELSFDWKISAQGNSGVMYRVTEENVEPYQSGPEYQVIDDVGYPGQLEESQFTGACYHMYTAPKDKPVKPVGEWNTSKIVAKGNHIEHWLNGRKLFDYEIASDDWLKRKAISKWKDEANYGIAKSGYIDFQDHGNEVWYKNILIKTL